MKEIYYVYNNEAISSCIFLSILNRVENIEIARACLILPFLLDDRTVSYLTKNKEQSFSLEEIIKQQSHLFISFNKRYLSLLPVSINSLILLNKANKIIIKKELIYRKHINIENQNLGIRYNKIEDIIPKFLSIIDNYSTNDLYKILKIQL
ncbi:hypothetical protein KRX57_04910 [Weeksellaceae bacterium TAE3-ERU29]|nr:hypothetical protein [Weeksellaceae bacterium TAE3-ERU29]